jgi:multiple sugar transport system permease protein
MTLPSVNPPISPRSKRSHFNVVMLLWLLPSLVSFVIILVPFFSSVYYSFTNYKPLAADQTQWVGLSNWITMFQAKIFRDTLGVTLRFWLTAMIIEIPLGIGVALVLNREIPGKGIFRTILILPMMIPMVVSGLTWQLMMAPLGGVLNYLLRLVNLSPQSWLADSDTALNSIVLIDTWYAIPFIALIILAALQSIPQEFYECAQIDGASALKIFLQVTLPLISPYIVLVAIFRTIDLLKVFGVIFITTEGGPGLATMTLHMEAYDRAFRQLDMGGALPYALFLMILLAVSVYSLEYIWNRAVKFVGSV